MPRPLRVNVFEFMNYREFLRAAYVDLKENQRGFSYRWFSRRAGMSSPNFLKLVIEGQRNLGPESTEQFADALGLGTQECSFFRELVAFNQAKTPAEKNLHFGNIGQFRKHRAVKKLERNTFEYLSHWYYPAIRELVSCKGFREDHKWIAARLRPRVTQAQVRKAIDVLLKIGVLVRDESSGELSQSDPLLSTGPEIQSLAVRNFHRQMIERGSAAIETFDISEREVSGTTVPLSQRGFQILKERIHALRAELLELSAEDEDPTRVVQFNFQAFPLAISEETQ